MSLTATARSVPGTLRQEVLVGREHGLVTDEVAIDVSGDLDAGQLERLDTVAAACPVRRALEAGFAFSERLRPIHGAPHEAAT